MKLPLAILATAACAIAPVAFGQSPTQPQKQNPKKQDPAKMVTPASNTGGSHTSFVGPNDNCASATVISGPGPFAYDTNGANTDGPAACGTFTADVWYDWTAGSTGVFILDLCAGGSTNTDTEVAVYDTAACVGAQLACNDDYCGFISHLVFSATSGNVYKIRVGGFNGHTGTGTFTVILAPPPPANDSCLAPTAISGNGPFAWSNNSASTDGGAENCPTPEHDVWFSWVAPSTGSFDASLCAGSSTDTVLAIYGTAGCPGAGTAIACDDDFCAAFGPSQANFTATSGSTYMIRIGGWHAAEGSGTFTIAPPAPPPTNDDCAAPIAISGGGPFPFDITQATTGSQGQGEALCNFYNLTGVDNDIWYTWTASATGTASVSTCGQASFDSKIAVYPGAGCPTGSAIGCSDDVCGLQSTACFPATNGQTYTIQVGSYPGSGGGSGTFSISVASGGLACQYDDGTSENMLGWTAGGDMVWLQRFGSSGGGSTTVSNIQVAYGSAAFPGVSPGNGSPVRVAIWDDPNDDGDPSDAVLLQVVNSTVANVDTDQLNTIAITPVSVNGVFFVGASEVHVANQFVAVMDQSGCLTPGAAWFCGNNNATPSDLVNLSNNAQLPMTFDSAGFACNLLLRAGCNVSPVSAFCLPGQGGVHACPCANPPAGAGLGCNNFGAGPADSATLTGAGTAAIASDTLVFTSAGENNTSFTIFAQGTTQLPAGVVFGAGVRCVAGVLKRLYTGNAVGGTIVRPGGSDPSVHVRSAALGYTIVPPITLYYFAYYRDPAAAGPCGSSTATFNATQGGAVLWQ